MSLTTRAGRCCHCMHAEGSGMTVFANEVALRCAGRSDLRRRGVGVVVGRKRRARGIDTCQVPPAGCGAASGAAPDRPTRQPAGCAAGGSHPGAEWGKGGGTSTAAGRRRQVLRYESVPGRRTRIMASRSPPPSSARLLVSEALRFSIELNAARSPKLAVIGLGNDEAEEILARRYDPVLGSGPPRASHLLFRHPLALSFLRLLSLRQRRPSQSGPRGPRRAARSSATHPRLLNARQHGQVLALGGVWSLFVERPAIAPAEIREARCESLPSCKSGRRCPASIDR
jgi:hypothetical protein